MFITSSGRPVSFRCVASSVLITFVVSFISPIKSFAQSPADLGLPQPGSMISLTSNYVPLIVKGLRVHPENPILFDFIVDTGNSSLAGNNQQLRAESEKLIKYFLAALTIPETDLWVNLSPYEKDRIVSNQLGQTDMGRDMLAQDYILKQLTASLIYPEKELGKEFWNKVYAKAQTLYGSAEVPVNTFNKVWIVADKAKVFVHDNTAFVVQSHLKVMLEEDYLATQKQSLSKTKQTNNLGNQIVREIVLPALENEVNQGRNFANLRQIYHSMILATWYKKNLKDSLLSQVYANKAKINGVDTADKTIKEQIYQEYLKAYKKGVFNYIKEDNVNGQAVPRKYFSGGLEINVDKALTVSRTIASGDSVSPIGQSFAVTVTTPKTKSSDLAMVTIESRLEEHLGDFVQRMIDEHDRTGKAVTGVFNGVTLLMQPGVTKGDILSQFQSKQSKPGSVDSAMVGAINFENLKLNKGFIPSETLPSRTNSGIAARIFKILKDRGFIEKGRVTSKYIPNTTKISELLGEANQQFWGYSQDIYWTLDFYQRTDLPQERVASARVEELQGVDSAMSVETMKHTVSRGETLANIADRYDMSVKELADLNDLSFEAELKAGQVLQVKVKFPSRDNAMASAIHTVSRSVESLRSIADRPGDKRPRINYSDIIRLNKGQNGFSRTLNQRDLDKPLAMGQKVIVADSAMVAESQVGGLFKVTLVQYPESIEVTVEPNRINSHLEERGKSLGSVNVMITKLSDRLTLDDAALRIASTLTALATSNVGFDFEQVIKGAVSSEELTTSDKAMSSREIADMLSSEFGLKGDRQISMVLNYPNGRQNVQSSDTLVNLMGHFYLNDKLIAQSIDADGSLIVVATFDDYKKENGVTPTVQISFKNLFLADFDLKPEQIEAASTAFKGALDQTLDQQQGAGGLSYLNSFLKPATGKEQGQFIGVDFSGTNLKIVLVQMVSAGEPKVSAVKEVKFPEALKNKTSAEVFGFVASLIKQLPIDSNQSYPIGLSFAFPMSHESASQATVLRLAKGWNLSDIVGKNPGQLLEEAINQDAQLKDRFKVVGVMNDTIATQLSSPQAVAGIILGTGFNFAIADGNKIINLEAGASQIVSKVRASSDNQVLSQAEPNNAQMFEKMVSGKYLIQLLRMKVLDLARLLPQGNMSDLAKASWDNIESDLLGKIVSLRTASDVSAAINEALKTNVSLSEQEMHFLKVISSNLLIRSGRLLAAAIAPALDHIEKQTKRDVYRLVIDGSVYWKNKLVQVGFETGLEALGWSKERLEIVQVANASAVGAAIGAAVASQKDPNSALSRHGQVKIAKKARGPVIVSVGPVEVTLANVPSKVSSLEELATLIEDGLVDGQPITQDTIEAIVANISAQDKAMTSHQPGADLQQVLNTKLASIRAEIQPLLDAYVAAKATNQMEEAKRLDGEINKIIDRLNVFAQSNLSDLSLSNDVETLASFLQGADIETYRTQAKERLLSGNYVPQFIFAGAATRLNRGPMYDLDIWDIAKELGKATDSDAKFHLGMGPRQILAYRQALEDLAKQTGRSLQDVLANQKIIINVNADIEDKVLSDFTKHDFYGFNPAQVFFVVQPTYQGYQFKDGQLEFNPQSPSVPYGHGHNFMQLAEGRQAFTLDKAGNRNYLQEGLISAFSDQVLIGSHRINDLTKLSKTSVISIDTLAYSIAKLGQGFDVVGELVDNPAKQKGGNVLKDNKTGKSFLIETSNVKGSPQLVSLLDEAGKVGAPYNAFRLVYNVGSLKRILQKHLPFNLRFKEGFFYLEAVTGDVTQMPETNAKFMSSGEVIHDFKEPKNIDDALRFLKQSDEQLLQIDAAMGAKTKHTVEPGETVNSIASKYGMGDEELARLNKITPQTQLKVGDQLVVEINEEVIRLRRDNAMSAKTKHTVEPGETVSSIASKYGMGDEELARLNKITPQTQLKVGDQLVVEINEETIRLRQDDAMVGQKMTRGGIDLNSKNMLMDVNGDTIDIRFDPAMIEEFKRGNFTGVSPVILKITPVLDVRVLLGLAPLREEEFLAKV